MYVHDGLYLYVRTPSSSFEDRSVLLQLITEYRPITEDSSENGPPAAQSQVFTDTEATSWTAVVRCLKKKARRGP